MRLKIRCDCTGEPPGELTISATAGAFIANAFLSSGATEDSVRPDWKRDSLPMVPASLTTGISGASAPGTMRR